MSQPRSSRRKFFRQAGFTFLGAALAACGRREAPPEAQPTAAPAHPSATTQPTAPPAAPTAAAALTILSEEAEVWAWTKRVTGEFEALACDTIQLQVNGQPVETAIDDTQFSADLPLQEGENEVTAACQPSGQASRPVTFLNRLRNVPVSNIRIEIADGKVLVDGRESQPAPSGGSPIREWIWSARETNPEAIQIAAPGDVAGQALEGEVRAEQLVLVPPQTDGEYYLNLQVVDEAGRSDRSTTYFVVQGGQPRLDDWETENTDWVEEAVVYGVVTRKFGSSKSFQGIIDRLDAWQELGINALWLSPIHPSPYGDYGYAVLDYFDVRKQFGTLEDFRRLVDEAHRRGIRVLMDFVPNHSSSEHRYFQDMVKNGLQSHYWAFYEHDETGAPTHYFDWDHLPNLDYNNPEVQTWMTEAFAYWVREFDVDGFRVDVAWGIRERNPEYWPKWRRALKRIKPDLLLLAEASARDEYYFTSGFDAAYDWTGQLGHWAWELVFEKDNLLTYNLNAALTNANNGYHPDALIFRFINNNDTGERFITQQGIGRTRVATALLLTLPGIPCIYTGDEIGAEFTPYGDPQPLNWDEDTHNLFAYHQQLIGLRRRTPALHSRAWQVVELEPHQQMYGYLRFVDPAAGSQPEASPVLVLLNFLDQPAEVEVQMPEGFEDFVRQPLKDLLSGVSYIGSGRFPMEPYGVLILTPNQS